MALPILKVYYERWAIHQEHINDQDDQIDERIEEEVNNVLKSAPASYFEVIVIRFSFTIDAILTFGIGLATSAKMIGFLICLLSLGAGALPSLKALMIAFSTRKKDRSAILGSLYVIDALGQVLSPITLGGIFAATVSKHPGLVFGVSSALIFLSTVPTYFIKQTDLNPRR